VRGITSLSLKVLVGIKYAEEIRLLKNNTQPIYSEAEKAGYHPARSSDNFLFQKSGQRTGDTLPESYQLVPERLCSAHETAILEMEMKLPKFPFLKFV